MTAARYNGLAANLSAGFLVAFLSANFALSYATLLFAGTTPDTQARGLVMMLTGSFMAAIVGARLSSMPFSVLSIDGTLIALLASITSDVVADMAGRPNAAIAATLLVLLMLATAVTGASLWFIGQLRGGSVVRYIPFPMMAGVLAASGWSLSAGGAAIAVGHPLDFASMTDPGAALRLALGVTLGLTLLAISARIRNPVALPAAILAVVSLYHGTAALTGWTIAAQHEAGWLLTLPPHLPLTNPWSADLLDTVDWPVLGHHTTSLLALIPVTAICLLLGTTGIETATGRDASANQELKANGIAAVACGALGGVLCITSGMRTMLVYKMGVRGPGASLLAGLLGVAVPMLWPGLLGLLPRFVLGGLLLFAGLGMLQQWALRSRRRLTWSEYGTVLLVLAIAARFGLIAGASAGLLLGCILFAVIYSHGSPIRARYRGNVARSHVDRSDAEEKFLAAQDDTLLVMHLQGFVFFGTASRLADEIRQEIAATPGRLRHLILDFANVQGIDGSALASFERLRRLAAAEGIELVLATMPPAVASRLATLPGASIPTAPTLDAALERRETALLAGSPSEEPTPLRAMLAAEFDQAGDAAAFLSLLECAQFSPGEQLVCQGDLSEDLLFIEQGRASVTVRFRPEAEPMRVRVFGAGAMVGEIGFCLGLPRTATVTADEPVRLLRLTQAALRRMEAEHPAAALAFHRAVLRRLGKRLLNKDQLISALVLDRTG